jgi:hypothetical protein
MARRSAVPSRADARSAPARKYASPDDGVLDEDSEVDEFALGREDEPSDEELEEEEEQEGMVQWEPDDWEGEEDEMESDDEDDMVRLVSNSQQLMCADPFARRCDKTALPKLTLRSHFSAPCCCDEGAEIASRQATRAQKTRRDHPCQKNSASPK